MRHHPRSVMFSHQEMPNNVQNQRLRDGRYNCQNYPSGYYFSSHNQQQHLPNYNYYSTGNNTGNYFAARGRNTQFIEQHSQNCNVNHPFIHPTSPLRRSGRNAKSKHGQHSPGESKSFPKPATSTPLNVATSEDSIDKKIIEEASALKLPPEGKRFTPKDWKIVMKLFYRWAIETIEFQRLSGRTRIPTSSQTPTNMKSVKNFCDNILKRKEKRRQFAIHWKESGLKKVLDEAVASKEIPFRDDDPKFIQILDDHFSGRMRSTTYNLAREKALEERQREIFALWNSLELGSSHRKLYLMQLAIERPFHYKNVTIETRDQIKCTHNVSIDGYGGESYWNQFNCITQEGEEPLEQLHPAGVFPVNRPMIQRFWKCSQEEYTNLESPRKRRRISSVSGLESIPDTPFRGFEPWLRSDEDAKKTLRQISHMISSSQEDATSTLQKVTQLCGFSMERDGISYNNYSENNDKENWCPTSTPV